MWNKDIRIVAMETRIFAFTTPLPVIEKLTFVGNCINILYIPYYLFSTPLDSLWDRPHVRVKAWCENRKFSSFNCSFTLSYMPVDTDILLPVIMHSSRLSKVALFVFELQLSQQYLMMIIMNEFFPFFFLFSSSPPSLAATQRLSAGDET